jgi:hypothetical protein
VHKTSEQILEEEIAERRRARLAGEAPKLPLPVVMEPLSGQRAAILEHAHRRRAKLLRDNGRPGEALTSYRRLLALDSSQPLAHINVGRCLLSLGHTNEANMALAEGINQWYVQLQRQPLATAATPSGKKSSTSTASSSNKLDGYMLRHRADHEAYQWLQQQCAANTIHPELCQRLTQLRTIV